VARTKLVAFKMIAADVEAIESLLEDGQVVGDWAREAALERLEREREPVVGVAVNDDFDPRELAAEALRAVKKRAKKR
jgi:hypothetical protein